ncbi:sucrase ferredoxin [Mycolicibacterium austroafricanum]|uniref:sucrase ferredoxin n=1 Tax=Mycolicibacterium austroafricanum TaxID=39687 RepID=UPI003AF33AB8
MPCSEESLERDEPMYGTASAGSSWLLLELEGGWGPSAFLQSPGIIDADLGRAIVRRAESAGMRIAAIRRHGRRRQTPRWRWFVARSDVGRHALFHGEVDGAEDYLHLDLDGADGTAIDGPLVAVCAHGRHDRCCAVRGRAAAAAIAAAYPENTWECSHLGGDRFAATMLILPEGLCYGRVDSTDGAELVRLYLDGRLDDRFLRGRTSLPHAVQAAQHFARETLGENRIDTLDPVTVEGADDTILVVLAAEAGTVEVLLDVAMSEPLFSQCRATTAGPVRTFRLRKISA